MKLRCIECGAFVSTDLPKGTVVRGTTTCPECEERHSELAAVKAIVIPLGDLCVVPRRTVRSDLLIRPLCEVPGGVVCRAGMNAQGAVFAILSDGGKLGLKPGEFDFVCPFAARAETLLPCEDERIPGHGWRVVGTLGRVTVDGVDRQIARVAVGAQGWRLELEED
jgi:hypothetical protein